MSISTQVPVPRSAGPTRLAEILIVGGGLVGAPLALALADAGLVVAVVEALRDSDQLNARFDGRGTAVAQGSRRILSALGLWDDLAPHAGRIDDIRVSDGASPLFLHFDHTAIGDEPLGHIVENHYLRRAFTKRLRSHPNIQLFAGRRVTKIAIGTGLATGTLDDGTVIRAPLMVGADGRNSAVRAHAGIKLRAGRYGQTAIVTAVRHPIAHRNIAHERFLPAGPLALLPLAEPTRSSVVWTEDDATAERILALDDTTLGAAMTERFGDWLGPLDVISPRWRWPLGWHHADRYVAPRIALVGDAAHAIHPIAGQGVNLGWRDARALADVLIAARRLGQDIGEPGLLLAYQRKRRPDNTALLLATDTLNRLFSNDLPPVRLARDVGLAVVDRVPTAKHWLMRRAMGIG